MTLLQKSLLSIFCLLSLIGKTQDYAYTTLVFPPDVNKYPLLFLEYKLPTKKEKEEAKFPNTYRIAHPDILKRNEAIKKFISEDTTKGHKMVTKNNLDSFSGHDYKYVIKYKFKEIFHDDTHTDSDGNMQSSRYTGKMTIAFCFLDRQTGKEYAPYIEPTTKRRPNETTEELYARLGKVASDKKFFKSLTRYISNLNKSDIETANKIELKKQKAERARQKTGHGIVLVTFFGGIITFLAFAL